MLSAFWKLEMAPPLAIKELACGPGSRLYRDLRSVRLLSFWQPEKREGRPSAHY